MENAHYINVPLNDRGRESVVSGLVAFVDDDFKSLCLTDAQYDDVYWLFSSLNKKLGLMIAASEDELMPSDKVPEAIAVVEGWRASCTESQRSIADQMVELFRMAESSGMPVDFSF